MNSLWLEAKRSMKSAPKIMVVDDEKYTRVFFEKILDDRGYKTTLLQNGKEAIKRCEKESFDLVLLDLKMPGLSGEETLKRLRALEKSPPVIIITAYGDKSNYDKMLRIGASDFFTKPFIDIDAILSKINGIISNKEVKPSANKLTNRCGSVTVDPFSEIVGKSREVRNVIRTAKLAAASFCSVFIQGESGTGKEMFARGIHNASPLKAQPFMPINCGAIPDTLLQSILFGHEKGAFTNAYTNKKGVFEMIDGGTLFLDEIADTSLAFQLQLLRVLQHGEFMSLGSTQKKKVDFRLLASTNKDIDTEVKKENFRQDLLYRINVVTLLIPPLRKRKEDIPLLLNHYMSKFCDMTGVKQKIFSIATLDVLQGYPWEGNIRELENFVHRVVILLRDKPVIEPEDLPGKINNKPISPAQLKSDAKSDTSFKAAKSRFEKEYILNLLQKTNGDLQMACQIADIDLATLYRKMKKHEISRPNPKFNQ